MCRETKQLVHSQSGRRVEATQHLLLLLERDCMAIAFRPCAGLACWLLKTSQVELQVVVRVHANAAGRPAQPSTATAYADIMISVSATCDIVELNAK